MDRMAASLNRRKLSGFILGCLTRGAMVISSSPRPNLSEVHLKCLDRFGLGDATRKARHQSGPVAAALDFVALISILGRSDPAGDAPCLSVRAPALVHVGKPQTCPGHQTHRRLVASRPAGQSRSRARSYLITGPPCPARPPGAFASALERLGSPQGTGRPSPRACGALAPRIGRS